jgi:hypothetical protein
LHVLASGRVEIGTHFFYYPIVVNDKCPIQCCELTDCFKKVIIMDIATFPGVSFERIEYQLLQVFVLFLINPKHKNCPDFLSFTSLNCKT